MLHEANVLSWNSDWKSGSAYAEIESQRGADALEQAKMLAKPVVYSSEAWSAGFFNGEKYPGGLGPINELFDLDYWGLRARSNELFHKNAYARGIIRRLVTNTITTGLHLESTPDESIIGLEEDALIDWAEDIETRFFIYGDTPDICDYKGIRNMGEIQRTVKTESLIGGDCLVILRQHNSFKLPTIQVVPGERVQTPIGMDINKNIVDGVELDSSGRHVAFYVTDENNQLGYQRIPAYGKKTGRPQAKLIYGCDKREDGVRGVPVLGIAIQPLAEIDRHRDSTQRKATLNSILVSLIERDANFKGTKSGIIGKGANRKDSTVDVTDSAGVNKNVLFNDLLPGLNLSHLQPGEKATIVSNNGVDINFGAFEAAIIMGLAWALEIPPEILLLSFNKNYSASQAAINEFKMYLEKERCKFGSEFCDFVYQDWFLSMTLLNKIDSGSYIIDYMTPDRWDAARAWTLAEWSGQMKPSTDLLKTVKAYGEAIDRRLITMARAIREIFGLKGVRVWKQLRKELQIVSELNKIVNPISDQSSESNTQEMLATIVDKLEDAA